MKIVEMLRVRWWHSSGTTVWVSELDTKIDNRHCLQATMKAWLRSQRHRKKGAWRGTSLSRKRASFHISFFTSHCAKKRVCLVPVYRFNTEKWYCLLGICTFGFEKNAKPRVLIKEALKILSCGKLSERTLGRILCRKEASNKYWSCLLLFSSFTFKYIWL